MGAIRSSDEMIASLDGRISELMADKQTQLDRIDDLTSQREGIKQLRSTNAIECEKLESELEELKKQRIEVESGNDEYEREINNIRIRLKVTISLQIVLKCLFNGHIDPNALLFDSLRKPS